MRLRGPGCSQRLPQQGRAVVAAVASAALTENGHVGRVYELTGPRLLTFSAAAAEIAYRAVTAAARS
ncbi:hypothetical protein [Saccharopolyspora aridisoli]|uniref:hypothetical protein n=1 Tax=Saccharopolyspora aridisoli TaxID=2530385 RepID=UPI001A9F0D39|nr:hypothetical protein [Saccharopolyspora aridisoli]